jgi:hypothetical protein
MASGMLHPGNSGLPENLTEPPLTLPPLTLPDLESFGTQPNIWLAADGLAKSLYSIILTDLGQSTDSTDTLNILHNETALQFFRQNLPDMEKHFPPAFRALRSSHYEVIYNHTHAEGKLGTSPSFISTNYLCQIPSRKSWGTVVISIVIADLVFMQALWKLFNLITSTFLTRKHADGKLALLSLPPSLSLSLSLCDVEE